MANLPELLRSYSLLQRSRYTQEISDMTTLSGVITITVRGLMAFGGIEDEHLLSEYEVLMRKVPTAAGFRQLLRCDYDRNSRHGSKKFTFFLGASADSIRQLLSNFTLSSLANSPQSNSLAVNPCPLSTVTPSLKRSRMSKIDEYKPATLERYSKAMMDTLMECLSGKIPSANVNLQNQVLNDVVLRLRKKLDGTDSDSCKINNVIVFNIKSLITSMGKFGRNDREQIRFKENIALAVSGRNSQAKLMEATGLSRRIIEHARKMRAELDIETDKAVAEVVVQDDHDNDFDLAEDEIDNDEISEADSEGISDQGEDSDEDSPQLDASLTKKRAANGKGKRNSESKNRYRAFLSAKEIKIRVDMIKGENIQGFCHNSPFGGRVDTSKLTKQPVLVEQPRGGFEYEPVRSYQFSVKEMYCQFKDSDYGMRQRNDNHGRDMSLRRFRELICPCMTKAKQRDTADQIVAEFKQCLKSWDTMRKKDNNVKSAIARCMTTECPSHKEGTATAALYAAASKTTSNFLTYMLCPKIDRNELAVQVIGEPNEQNSYKSRMENQMQFNLKAAEERKAAQIQNFNASCTRKGEEILSTIVIMQFDKA